MKDLEAPNQFLDWNFYFMVASCLGRRAWIGNGFDIYPNIYVIFVAKPGFGKSMPASHCIKALQSMVDIKKTESGQIIEKPVVNISPNSVTLEALWDYLADSTRGELICNEPKKYAVHSSVSFCLPRELGILFKENTVDLITFLNEAYDCENFDRKTRTRGEVHIKNMCVSLLGCCTPDWMARNMRNSLLDEGMTARAIFLYGDKHRKRTSIITISDEQKAAMDEIKVHLRTLAKTWFGELSLSPEVMEWLNFWVHNKMDKRVNLDKRLDHYYGRKKVHLLKLAMLLHFSETTSPVLTIADLEKALRVLENAEIQMHLALASGGENPLYSLGLSIIRELEINGGREKGLTEKYLKLFCWDKAPEEDTMKTLNFLVDSGQLGRIMENGKVIYKLLLEKENLEETEKIENFPVEIKPANGLSFVSIKVNGHNSLPPDASQIVPTTSTPITPLDKVI